MVPLELGWWLFSSLWHWWGHSTVFIWQLNCAGRSVRDNYTNMPGILVWLSWNLGALDHSCCPWTQFFSYIFPAVEQLCFINKGSAARAQGRAADCFSDLSKRSQGQRQRKKTVFSMGDYVKDSGHFWPPHTSSLTFLTWLLWRN